MDTSLLELEVPTLSDVIKLPFAVRASNRERRAFRHVHRDRQRLSNPSLGPLAEILILKLPKAYEDDATCLS